MDPTDNAAGLPHEEVEEWWPSCPKLESMTPQMWVDHVEERSQASGIDIAALQPLHRAAMRDRADVVEFMLERGYDKDGLNGTGCTALHIAAMDGSATAVQALLAAGADVSPRVSDISALDWAAGYGHLNVARTMVEYGVDVNAAGTDGHVPLHYASFAGTAAEEMVSVLLSAGAEVDAADDQGRTPLHLAAKWGRTEATRALLRSGAGVNLRGNRDMSALDRAAEGGHVDVARVLVEHGADVKGAGTDGSTALHYLGGDSSEMVSFLLASGAEVDAADDQGLTPLHHSAIGGYATSTRVLLAAGADVSHRCSRDMSALDRAAEGGHVDVARVLVEHGADVKGAGTDGSTALHYPAGDNAEMVSLLCREGASVNAVTDQGCTPLDEAAIGGYAASTRALLAAGADVSMRCHRGLSALHRAAVSGNADIVMAIVEHGADVNAVGAAGHTALHLAAADNNAAAIEVLLGAGADIEAGLGEARHTPLFLVAAKSGVPAVAMLLKHGASVSMRSMAGKTPLHAAAASAGNPGTAEVVDLLLRRGADEKLVDIDGQTPADVLGSCFQPSPEASPVLDVDRVRKLLADAPADRAWRRRGYLVLCRAHYPAGRVRLGHGNIHVHDDSIVKRTRSRAGRSRTEAEWSGVARMLMGVGADPISLMGDGADIIFEAIVGFL
eukprot:g14084.t1